MSGGDIREIRSPRRIVTGTNEQGTSYLARVEEAGEVDYSLVLPPASDHGAYVWGGDRGTFHRIWGSDRLPIPLPNDGKAPFFDFEPTPEQTPEALRRSSTLPPPLGVRVAWSTNPLAGPPAPYHFTDSIDIVFVMSGHQGEILDEGETILRAGDVMIQNGTMHAHHSLTDEPIVTGYVIVGALGTGPHPPLDLLPPFSKPLGGHRRGETAEKQPLAPWTSPGPPSNGYPGEDCRPFTITDVVNPRRVVTGTNPEGKSYFARRELVEESHHAAIGLDGTDGHRVWQLWRIDRLPQLVPVDGLSAPMEPCPSPEDTPEALRRAPLTPGPLGVVVAMVRIAPMKEQGPMHTKDTMDVGFVMSGTVTHILDSGEEIDLGPGDVVIRNGTAGAWQNRGDRPAMLGVASFGAARFVQTGAFEIGSGPSGA